MNLLALPFSNYWQTISGRQILNFGAKLKVDYISPEMRFFCQSGQTLFHTGFTQAQQLPMLLDLAVHSVRRA